MRHDCYKTKALHLGALVSIFTLCLFMSACGSGSSGNNSKNSGAGNSSSSSGNSSAINNNADSSSSQSQETDISQAIQLLNIPIDFPKPTLRDDNIPTPEKIELGRFLFFDRALSINEARSCGDCHQPALAFSDGLETSIGIDDTQVHDRNAMSLTNIIYNAGFNWANPNVRNLEDQAHGVLFNETPIELGWTDAETLIIDRLKADVLYISLFTDAFSNDSSEDNTDASSITVPNIERALASFQRILISGDSEFDRFQRGDDNALSVSAKRGMNLFFSEQLECFHCHGGFNFSQSVDHSRIVSDQLEFHNNGLYNIGGTGDYPANNTGLWDILPMPANMGKFKAPTLRNIALTAPYMHDGSIATLADVIDHYSRGGRLIEEGPNTGDGNLNPYKSSLLTGFILSEQDKADLIAFFESLTDWVFVCRADLQDPFGVHLPHEQCNAMTPLSF